MNDDETNDNSGASLTEEQEENNSNQITSPIRELAYEEITEPIEKK